MVEETIILEVTGVDRKTWYPNGYSNPPETLTMMRLSTGDSGLRTAVLTIPGDLPLGTRFTLTVTQLDDVTAATIHRGALPIIDDSKKLKGTTDDIQ